MFLFNLILTLLLTILMLNGWGGDGDQAATGPPIIRSPIVSDQMLQRTVLGALHPTRRVEPLQIKRILASSPKGY
jgi:hypothetical protein